MIEQPKTLHATQAGDKFNLVLANTIHRDGTPESGKYDEVCVFSFIRMAQYIMQSLVHCTGIGRQPRP
jgi:hypothetical protein